MSARSASSSPRQSADDARRNLVHQLRQHVADILTMDSTSILHEGTGEALGLLSVLERVLLHDLKPRLYVGNGDMSTLWRSLVKAQASLELSKDAVEYCKIVEAAAGCDVHLSSVVARPILNARASSK